MPLFRDALLHKIRAITDLRTGFIKALSNKLFVYGFPPEIQATIAVVHNEGAGLAEIVALSTQLITFRAENTELPLFERPSPVVNNWSWYLQAVRDAIVRCLSVPLSTYDIPDNADATAINIEDFFTILGVIEHQPQLAGVLYRQISHVISHRPAQTMAVYTQYLGPNAFSLFLEEATSKHASLSVDNLMDFFDECSEDHKAIWSRVHGRVFGATLLNLIIQRAPLRFEGYLACISPLPVKQKETILLALTRNVTGGTLTCLITASECNPDLLPRLLQEIMTLPTSYYMMECFYHTIDVLFSTPLSPAPSWRPPAASHLFLQALVGHAQAHRIIPVLTVSMSDGSSAIYRLIICAGLYPQSLFAGLLQCLTDPVFDREYPTARGEKITKRASLMAIVFDYAYGHPEAAKILLAFIRDHPELQAEWLFFRTMGGENILHIAARHCSEWMPMLIEAIGEINPQRLQHFLFRPPHGLSRTPLETYALHSAAAHPKLITVLMQTMQRWSPLHTPATDSSPPEPAHNLTAPGIHGLFTPEESPEGPGVTAVAAGFVNTPPHH